MAYLGVEPYIQDNWKVNDKLTLDYGVRFVHLVPEHDIYGQASNFFPEQWKASAAPIALPAGLRGRRGELLGHQPPGEEPAHRPAAGRRHRRASSARRCPARAARPTASIQQGKGISEYQLRVSRR